MQGQGSSPTVDAPFLRLPVWWPGHVAQHRYRRVREAANPKSVTVPGVNRTPGWEVPRPDLSPDGAPDL